MNKTMRKLGAATALVSLLASSNPATAAEANVINTKQSNPGELTLEDALKVARNKHHVAKASPNEQSYFEAIKAWQKGFDIAQSKGRLEAQADVLYNQTELSWDRGLAFNNPIMYRNSVEYGLRGLSFIRNNKVRLNLEDDLHLFIAKASSKIDKTKDMFYHYFQVLIKSKERGIINGALIDLYDTRYNTASVKDAKHALQILTELERNKIRAMLIGYAIGGYVSVSGGNEVKEAKKIKLIGDVFDLTKVKPSFEAKVNAGVNTYLDYIVPRSGNNPSELKRLKTMPTTFSYLENGNPLIAQVHKSLTRYFANVSTK